MHFMFDLDGVLIDACTIHRDTLREALAGSSFAPAYDSMLEDLEGRPTHTKLQMLGVPSELARIINQRKQDLTFKAAQRYPRDEARIRALMSLPKQSTVSVVTNCRRPTAYEFLKSAGLLPWIDHLVCTDGLYAKPKPHPDLYDRALNQCHTWREDAIAFEDTELGAEAARQAGIRVVKTTFQTLTADLAVVTGSL